MINNSFTYIGNAYNTDIRKKATSGGVGSALLKYMFETDQIQTAISFDFDENILQYVPKLIYSYDEYKITGSIYHEVNIFNFIKNNIEKLKGKIFLFLLPCQVKSIARLLDRNNIEHFIISLACSSQQSIDATLFLLKMLRIREEDVKHIQYRGNGWPGGVTIILKNGEQKFVSNNNSIWTEIFHSRLFIQKRCFKCNETISEKSDISLADPWLKEYIENENIGKSLIIVNTEKGLLYLNQAEQDKILIKSLISKEYVVNSQLLTILRKRMYKKHNKIIKFVMKIIFSDLYRSLFLKDRNLFKSHNKVIHRIEYLLKKM